MRVRRPPDYGALIISLDFELHWGVRDIHPIGNAYTRNLMGARQAIPRILDAFEEFGINATWATVGFLFAQDKDELLAISPQIRPAYDRRSLDPYVEKVGLDEKDDPLHFAPSLIRQIATTAGQEIGSHTFSHYYCLEKGQDVESFRADLNSAVAIAKERGIDLRSLVLPRNQINPTYIRAIAEAGFSTYRGSQPGWIYEEAPGASTFAVKRAARLMDTYLGISSPACFPWPQSDRGLCNVQASSFLRPLLSSMKPLENVRLAHVRRAINVAARTGQLVHLWWHPHNFGADIEGNVLTLRGLLQEFRGCQEKYGMRSLSMGEVAQLAASHNGDAVAEP